MRKACSQCGRVMNGGACPVHGLPRRLQTTSQRGYGSVHQSGRAAALPHAYGTLCRLCEKPMFPGQPLDFDHVVPRSQDPGSVATRMVHAACNRSSGAALAS